MNMQTPAAAMPGRKDAPLDEAASPSHAARGDDDLMSQPVPVAAANLSGNGWKSHIGRARRTWNKLPGAELARIDGDMARLAALLRDHYDFSDAEIDRQIIGFLGSKA